MILLGLCLSAFSLVLAWRSIRNSSGNSRRVLLLITASGLFFSSFFFLAEQFSSTPYISIKKQQWQATLSSKTGTIHLEIGEKTLVPFLVENSGTEVIDSMEKKNPVFLSFHILDSYGGMLQFDNARFAFSEPLRPQQQQRVVVVLDNAVLKLRPGNYIAEFDLVREESFWFQEREGMSLRIPLLVGEKKR